MIEVQFQHYRGGTKLNHEESQDSRNSNPAAPEHKSRVSLVTMPVLSVSLQMHQAKIIDPDPRRTQERMCQGEVLILSARGYSHSYSGADIVSVDYEDFETSCN
jgi:hypothetical protein